MIDTNPVKTQKFVKYFGWLTPYGAWSFYSSKMKKKSEKKLFI